MRPTTRTLLVTPLCVALPLLSSSPTAAQEGSWDLEAEVGGSVYFGNTSQTTLNTRLSTARESSRYEASSEAIFVYGESEDDAGDQFVAKRSWQFSGNLDWRPESRVTPFVFGEGSSSLERRIDFRYNVGGGGTYRFARAEQTRVDLSLAVLAEQTFVRPSVSDADESVLARFSTRFRARRAFDDERVVLSTENYYRPVVGEYGNYVIESQNSVSYALSEVISLRLSLRDIYDSRAVERGARSNNDGQFVVSVLSSF